MLFAAVFVEQIGVPLPALPWLFAAGALIGAGRMNWLVALGRRRGRLNVGRFNLVLSWTPLRQPCFGSPLPHLTGAGFMRPTDAECFHALRNTRRRGGEIHSWVEHAGAAPGGKRRLQPPSISFLRWQSGSLLYVGSFVAVGVLFSRQLEAIIAALASLGTGALSCVRRLCCHFTSVTSTFKGIACCANCGWRELPWMNCTKNRRRVKTRDSRFAVRSPHWRRTLR